ncbi:response regulator transcription factor [Sporolactobacillus vineae]|uniref:response regulator transcription factor n=1 Tax=Sporolactobacillus vineae TaxID=444463 RepID=UPI000288AB45|nr:response regulator transcription factor [Sporolactobacillus vineae]
MKLLIVDDDTLICDSLKLMIDLEEDMDVIGTCGNGEEAVRFCRNDLPDMVLMDIRMPVMDGVRATAELRKQWPALKIIMLTTFQDDAYIRQVLKNGAAGYLLKSQPADTIIATLRTAAKGSVVMSGEVAEKLSAMLGADASEPPKIISEWGETLTRREQEILALIAEGRANRDIAGKLFLSEGTVRNNVTRLLEKLNCRTRTQLAIYYLKHQP